jgi:hypothetical protein
MGRAAAAEGGHGRDRPYTHRASGTRILEGGNRWMDGSELGKNISSRVMNL